MFLPIFLFEIRYRLRQPATWIYFGSLLLIGLLLVATAGGAFGEGVHVGLGGDGQASKVNAPFSVGVLLTLVSMFGVVIVASLLGTAVHRDLEYRAHTLLYTLPLSKWGYLGGRFWGAYVVAVGVFSGIGLGAALGTMWPGVVAERFLPTAPLGTYMWPYVLLVLPNLFATGALFFTLAVRTRSILSTYVGVVLLLVGSLIAIPIAMHSTQASPLAALDAFGFSAQFLTTRYWTAAEKNAWLLPLSRYLLLNRAVWLGVGAALLGWCYAGFRFSAFAADKPRRKVPLARPTQLPAAAGAGEWRLPLVHQVFNGFAALAQWWSLTKLEFSGILRSRYFAVMAGAGVLYLLSTAGQAGTVYDTPTYPVTGMMLGWASSSFTLFLLVIIIFYSGELVWREREASISQLVDAAPVPTWVPLLSKLAALVLVQVLLLGMVLASCLLVQTSKGYVHYEMGLYVQALFGYELPYLVLLCVLAIGLQVVINNKHLGFLGMVLFYLADLFRGQLGLTHRLLGYGGDASPGTYSDLNGYGHLLAAFWWTKLYWAGVALLLLVVANLWWVRGTNASQRWQEARRRLGAGSLAGLATGLVLVAGAGSFIFYNTNVLNHYRIPQAQALRQVAYEQQYRHLKAVPQPRIVAVQLHTDIYPAVRAVAFRGHYVLVNKHPQALGTIIVSLAPSHHPRLRQLELGAPGRAWLALRDTVAGLYLFRLARPLAPGDSLTLALQVRYQERGFPNDNPNLDVVTNGTFVTNAYLPSLGYMEAGELSDNQVRHQYGLAPQPGLANAHNLAARQNNYLSQDADWVRFEATVSTSLDQTAVAPGTLQRTWVQQGRRYFAYRADRPILNFYAFLSARYLQFHDQWLDSAGHRTVPITIYYQPGHDYNLRRLAAGAKEALAYCSGNFSPYPHRELRIVEFPRYQRYAQSFATMVAFSEGLGFVAHVDDHNPQSLDYPFYVTAHEVAHQWWAHQVIGANVEGCTLLSESLAEYTALMVMRQHYGLAAMERLLRLDMGRYLEGRSLAKQPEVPLARVGSQEYLHYRKGSVMFYALQDYMGESQLNGALRRYVQAMAFRPPPYPSAPELLDYLRQAAPDSLHPLLTDFFDRITLYNNRVIGPATATRLPDGRYRVSFTVRCAKFYADSLGQQHPAALSREALPVAIFPAPGPDKHLPLPMLLVKRRLATGDNRLQFTVADKPAAVAIDPYHELADRDLDDNKLEITP